MIEINSVGYEHDELHTQAQELAERLHCTLNKDSPQCLFVTDERLTLKIPAFSLMSADFSTKTWSKRKAEGKKQGMVRACKPAPGQKIIDATAGWGRDAAILASFGAEVLMLERNPIMATLLTDALAHRTPTEQQEMKLALHQEDAFSYLSALQPHEYPDVIYIDPMHPQRTKSALVKKDMQVLQDLIGPDEDALALIQLAITKVKHRVVVKWPQKIKALIPSTTSVEGKTVRFDIYCNAK